MNELTKDTFGFPKKSVRCTIDRRESKDDPRKPLHHLGSLQFWLSESANAEVYRGLRSQTEHWLWVLATDNCARKASTLAILTTGLSHQKGKRDSS